MRKLLKMRVIASRFLQRTAYGITWRGAQHTYSISLVWEELRPKRDKVDWHRLVWCQFHIPKHAIIACMAILNRLPTKDRLVRWEVTVDGDCYLCRPEGETQNHLFFGCRFSKEIRQSILQFCGLQRRAGDWERELQWAVHKLKGKALIPIIVRIAWAAYIYHLWQERNRRIFSNAAITGEQILQMIKEDVRTRLARLKGVAFDPVNRRIA